MERMTVNNDSFFMDVIGLLREGKRVTIPVNGVSMLPFIVGNRDLVVLEGVEEASPIDLPRRSAQIGDAVLFRCNGHFLLHRILGFNRDGTAVIQGDGVLASKEYCGRKEIFGRVVFVLKRGKRRVDVNSKWYSLKLRVWLALTPFRRIILGIRRRVLVGVCALVDITNHYK